MTRHTTAGTTDVETIGLDYTEADLFFDEAVFFDGQGNPLPMQEYVIDGMTGTEVIEPVASIECPFEPARITGQRSVFFDDFERLAYEYGRLDRPLTLWDLTQGRNVDPTGPRDVVSTGPVNDFRIVNPAQRPLDELIREVNACHRPAGRR